MDIDFNNDDVTFARQRLISDIPRLQARRSPDKVALIYEGNRDSYADLERLVNRFANHLIALGIAPGDRVAIFSHNCRSFVIARFGIIHAGAIFTPINFMLNPAEVGFILDHSKPRAIISEDALCGIADEAIAMLSEPPRIKAYINHTGTAVPDGWIDLEEWLGHPDESRPNVLRGEDDPVQLIYTSGTEAHPKGVLLSSRSLFSQYVSCIVDGEMRSDDVELHCLPLYHCAQLDCFLSVDLYLGATSILLRAPDAGIMLETIEREKVTKLFCPPTVWIALLRHPDFGKRDLSSLRKGYYGASIMPVAIIEELLRRLPEMRLWNFYGQTEMAPVATILKPEDQLRKRGSAGRPAINVETCVVDDDDRPVAIGEIGEIVHRSPQAMLGYYRDAEKTADAFRGGWFHSGDLGRFDEDGFLYLVDRKKDMIKSGGENVASRDVEEVLFLHDDILEAAVFGVPDEKWIEAVTAVIVPRPGASIEITAIHAHCRAHLAAFKCPKSIHIVDKLPKNASGKILKREIRANFIGRDG
jgi:fatty-acyl-CoA synthase